MATSARISPDVIAAFDADFYRFQQPDLAALSDHALLRHFMDTGWHKGLDPRPDFSVRRYLARNSDVAAAKVNPFVHYLARGQSEGRVTYLSLWGQHDGPELAAHLIATLAPLFDAAHYRRQRPDLAHLPDTTLLSHYLVLGWTLGLAPNPTFSSSAYLAAYPDVRHVGINPFVHFALYGQREGRQIAAWPPDLQSLGAPPKATLDALAALSDSDAVARTLDAFDADFYAAQYPDMHGAAADLALHYHLFGWREGRNPSADFDTRYYLHTNAQLAARGVNPLLHYTEIGKAEGRRASGDGTYRLLKGRSQVPVPPHLRVVLAAAEKPSKRSLSPAKINPDMLRMHWIIPDFRPGSGGHMTIFRMIKCLEGFGHRCKIWIEDPVFHTTPEAAWDNIVKHFQCVAAEVDFARNGLYKATGDVVIATGWSTAYLARAATGFHEKFYFVQDHEVEFYPTGAERLLAGQTYHFGLSCICASPWLEALMRDRYGLWARSFHLAYDPEIYAPRSDEAPRDDGPLRIAVYARDHTARRCVALSLLALELLAMDRDDFEVHFFGQAELSFMEAPYAAMNHGVLTAPQLAALYRRCDVGICFSGTNYSLVPQEMMASGLPVVELDGESTRAIFPKGVVTLAGPDPRDIAAKLAKLLDTPTLRHDQAKRASGWVAGLSWDASARIVEAAIRDRLLARKPRKIAAPSVAKSKQVLLDVVIPTWNGMGELPAVIGALRGQGMAEDIQIHCIDSQSTDGTAEWLRSQADIALIQIDQASFQHGRTRNQAAASGAAPLIAFLTQDAIPATRTWAQDICAMFTHMPQAAGLFGRHLPYPHHPAGVRREIDDHFANMMGHPLALSRETDPDKWASGDVGWRQFLHFYSDNNSAMRRSVWAELPYPEVDYGEDQLWARDIIAAGLTKLFAPTACVYHSHDYDPDETFKRARTEAAFFFRYFGYTLGDGSEEEIAVRIDREQIDYRGWAYRHRVPPEEEPRRIANIAAKHRGWKAGLDEARGPCTVKVN